MTNYLRIYSHLNEQPWAITPRAMESMLAILERPVADLEAVAAKLGRPLENTGNRVEERQGVAVLSIEGPIFRYANLFTMISGATSVELLARDFQTAMSDSRVESILLNVNSPGGEADGVNELADLIRENRGKKPITAYVGGLAASGAYWLASAADRIVVNDSAFLGSIGVVATVLDSRPRQEKEGVKRYEIVSSQSPRKRPDVATDAGRAQVQEMVDAAADLFVSKVARNRGVSVETVLADFGQGGVLRADKAFQVRMADAQGSFESLMRELASNRGSVVSFAASKQPIVLSQGTFSISNGYVVGTGSTAAPSATALATQKENAMANPATTDQAPAVTPEQTRSDAVKTERLRVATILNAPAAQGREKLAQTLALESDLAPETAIKLLESAHLEKNGKGFSAAMANVPNPKVGADDAEDTDASSSEISRILAFAPGGRK